MLNEKGREKSRPFSFIWFVTVNRSTILVFNQNSLRKWNLIDGKSF